MFRQFLGLSPAVCRSGRLSAVPARRLAASTNDSEDADKRKSAKLIRQRPDDLMDSMLDFNETVEKLRQMATSTQSRPAGEEPQRPPESARSTGSTRRNHSFMYETARPTKNESRHRPTLPPRPTDQELSDHLKGVRRNLSGTEDLHQLLDSINPVLPQLEGHQFVIVYKALEKQEQTLNVRRDVILETLRESSAFAALLNQTNLKIGEIDPSGLTMAFNFMRTVKQNPDSEFVRNVTKQIVKRLDELNLDQVAENLLSASLYSFDFPDSGQLFRFRPILLENSRRRVLNNELNPHNFEQVKLLFSSFLLNCENKQAINTIDRLTRTLLSDFELDFSRSIDLLGVIVSSLRDEVEARTKEAKEEVQYPAVLTELIEKCNSTVYATLKADPEASVNYLDQVHCQKSRLHKVFPNFFDPRLLDLLGPVLTKEEASSKDPKGLRKKRVLNLVHNYSHVHAFNEELIGLTCRLICNGLISNLHFNDYLMLFEYRFPFVNRQELLSAFKSCSGFLRSIKGGHRYQYLICDLILSEVNDPGMLNFLSQNVRFRPDQLTLRMRWMNIDHYDRTALARVVLSMFGQLEDKQLEAKLKRTLNEYFRQLCINGNRANLGTKYINADSRVQHPGFLSNGVKIDTFGIYDRSIGDLVPLERFRSKFGSVDSIPLTADQELVAFISKYRLKGVSIDYDTAVNYQMRRVLKAFNFKTIDIYIDDFKHLDIRGTVQHFIDCALDSYK